MLSPNDEYIAFVAYLRNNGVWKVVSNVFGMLNETRPEDPIEFLRKNVKPDNDDGTAVEQKRLAIAEAEEILTVLKRDRVALKAKWNSLDKRIRDCAERDRSVRSSTVLAVDESAFDSDHV